MAAHDEFSSFFATSLMDLKAPGFKGLSPIVAPTAEERQLLNCNSYGTFAIPLGTFRRYDNAASCLYRYDSVMQGVGARDASTASVVSLSRSASDDSSSSSSSASSERGLTNCRTSYANYNGASILGGRWDSGAYLFQHSGRAVVAARRRTAKENVTLPAIPAMSPSSPRHTFAKSAHILQAPTPPPIEVDFSCDNDDELLPYENKTQQFFRLAQQHRDQRVRLMDRHERRHRGLNDAKQQIPLAHQKKGTAAAAMAPPPQFLSNEKKIELPKLPSAPPFQTRLEEARNASLSAAKGRFQQPYYLMPLPAASAADAYRRYHSSLRDDTNMFGNQRSNRGPVMKNLRAQEPEESSESSSDSSYTHSESEESDLESIPSGERELWGVCALRDFPFVKSPVWAALDNSHHHSDESSDSDGNSSAASSESEDEDDAEVALATLSPSVVAMHKPRGSHPLPDKPAAIAVPTTERLEVSLYALKLHRPVDGGLPVNASHDTANSTACLTDSSSSSSSESAVSRQRDSRHDASPQRIRPTTHFSLRQQQQHPNKSSSKDVNECHVQPQPPQRYHEEAVNAREGNNTKIVFRPRISSLNETPTEQLRYRRPNGFRRLFKGVL